MSTEYDFYSLSIMAALISFLGFMLENTWLAFKRGFVDNRNMTLPFLLGYGLLVIGIYQLIGTPEEIVLVGIFEITHFRMSNYLAYFLIAMLVVSVGEILLGTTVEKLFGFEYWNYSSLPLHLTKYTSFFTSAGFAAIITLFMGKFFTPIMAVITQIPPSASRILGALFSAALTADFVSSFVKMYKTHSLNVRWRKNLSERRYTRKTT